MKSSQYYLHFLLRLKTGRKCIKLKHEVLMLLYSELVIYVEEAIKSTLPEDYFRQTYDASDTQYGRFNGDTKVEILALPAEMIMGGIPTPSPFEVLIQRELPICKDGDESKFPKGQTKFVPKVPRL